MENADLAERDLKTSDLAGGIRQKSRGNTSKLSKEDLVVILSELIRYAEKRLYSNRTRVKDKPTWARILRESITELVKVTKGELGEGESLEELLDKVPLKVLKLLERETGIRIRRTIKVEGVGKDKKA